MEISEVYCPKCNKEVPLKKKGKKVFCKYCNTNVSREYKEEAFYSDFNKKKFRI